MEGRAVAQFDDGDAGIKRPGLTDKFRVESEGANLIDPCLNFADARIQSDLLVPQADKFSVDAVSVTECDAVDIFLMTEQSIEGVSLLNGCGWNGHHQAATQFERQ